MPGFWILLVWNLGLTTALAIAIALVSCLKAVRHRPGIRHTLWMLVLLKLITPPLIPVPVLPAPSVPSTTARFDGRLASIEHESPEHRFHGAGMHVKHRGSGVAPHVSPGQAGSSPDAIDAARLPGGAGWFIFLVGFSATGTMALTIWSVTRIMRVARLLRRAEVGGTRLQAIARQAASQFGVRNAVEIRVVGGKVSPLLWVHRDRLLIVFPERLTDRLNDDQVSCIVRHELAHYVRRDHWANVFTFVVTALFWWHPAVWWARREMHLAQELCCDAVALDSPELTRRCYAETLYLVIEFIQHDRSSLPRLANTFSRGHSTRRRFEMIANARLNHHLARRTLAAVGVLAVLLSCFPVPGSPTRNGAEIRTAEAQTQPKASGAARAADTEIERPVVAHQDLPISEAADDEIWELALAECLNIALDNWRTTTPAMAEKVITDAEKAYWGLCLQYRRLDTAIAGRDTALGDWRLISAALRSGDGGLAKGEAQTRQQYFLFRGTVDETVKTLYHTEAQLRYVLGLARVDGRLIRPSDRPDTERIEFDWHAIHEEMISEHCALIEQREKVTRLEGNLLDAEEQSRGTSSDELRLLKERLIQERRRLHYAEVRLSGELADALRDVSATYATSQTARQRLKAATSQVNAVSVGADELGGHPSLDEVLDAHRRQREAELDYQRALVDYTCAISTLHRCKGTLLDRHGLSFPEER